MCNLHVLAAKNGRASGFCKVCDSMRLSVLFKIYNSRSIMKLLERYYLTLML